MSRASSQRQGGRGLEEESLPDQLAAFKSGIGSMADGFLLLGVSGRVLFFNDAFATLHRYPGMEDVPESLEGIGADFDAYDGRNGVFLPLHEWPGARALRGEEIDQQVLRVVRRDSGEAWFASYSFSPVRNARGELIGATCVVREVSDIMKTESELRDVSQRLQLATRSARLGVWDWNILENRMLWDDRMLELYGIERSVLASGVNAWTEGLHPEDRERAITALRASMEGRQEFDLQFRVLQPSGKVVYIKANGLVVRDSSGHAVRMIGVNADITAQKEAELALRRAYAEIESRVEERTAELKRQREMLLQSESRLKRAQSIAHVGDFELEVESGRLVWSEELFHIWGLDPAGDAPTISDLEHLVLPDYRADFSRVIDEAIRLGKPWELVYPLRRKDGGLAYNHTLGMASRDERGIVVRLNGVVQDVTREETLKRELATARDAAEAANRAKDLFLATLSHELKSPLTAILLWSQLLNRGVLSPERTRTATRTIEENALAQNQLINDLLDVSRIMSGKVVLEKQVVSLHESLRKTIETVLPSAEAKGVAIEEHLCPEELFILADPVRMKQIVWNLLTNSIKFTPAGGRVEVLLEALPNAGRERASVRIRDTGKGIRADYLPHLFEAFSQADASSQRMHGGLGLGLSIVRHLVDQHEGTIRAESEGEGRGATFTLIFPLAAHAVASTEKNIEGLRGGPSAQELRAIRILLVEDDDRSREALEHSLDSRGARVLAVPSARAGFEAVGEFHPDVIVSDIAMPGEDGCSMMRRIRKLPDDQGGRTVALALTAYADARTREAVMQAGFQAHVAKPVEADALVRAILDVRKAG